MFEASLFRVTPPEDFIAIPSEERDAYIRYWDEMC
jgi:hypothetical protein